LEHLRDATDHPKGEDDKKTSDDKRLPPRMVIAICAKPAQPNGMESIISAVVGFIAGLGTGYAISIKVISKRAISGHGRETHQSKIQAGGDVAGGDIKKNSGP
jgi:hypothetical protein